MLFFEEEDKKKRISFGTTQNRKGFPLSTEPNKLGTVLKPIRGSPNLGPGVYNDQHYNTIAWNIDRKTVSNKGIIRTGPRLIKKKYEKTPCPTAYQTNWTKQKQFVPSAQPFNIKEKRFNEVLTQPQINPGPGNYNFGRDLNRKIVWPQQFGRPIHPIEPNLPKRSVRAELMVDKEYRKFKNKVAYFRLYY